MAAKMSDLTEVYKDLGLFPLGELGSVLLPMRPVSIVEDFGVNPSVLYTPNDPETFWWIEGETGSKDPHVTLIMGLVSMDGRLTADDIELALEGWDSDAWYEVLDVELFYSKNPDEPYAAVVLTLADQYGTLNDANTRLRRLPNIDSYGSYRPHMTLAYVNADDAEAVRDHLSYRVGLLHLAPSGDELSIHPDNREENR